MKKTKMQLVFVFFCGYAASQGLACSAVALVKVQIQGSNNKEAPDIR
jgi:aerobic-type carbon monoxide dehydrogenase small subunit (CoxS/CutS family)